MSSEQASCLDDHRITSDLSNIETSSRIRLQLHYKDHRQDLKVEKYVSFSLTDTIRDVIKKFLETAGLDHVSPSDVSLVELGIGNQRSRPSSLSEYLTLDELNIKEGHDLYFEPSIMAATSRLFHLTIWGPSPITRVEYEWDRTTTTLKMLLEYVIKVFSLETIESQRIHLFQQLEELDLSSNADKLLIDLGIKDRSLIEVEIIPPISFSDSYVNTITPARKLSFLNKQISSGDVLYADSNRCIELELQYTDRKQDFKKIVKTQFSPATIIRDVIKQLLKTLGLNHILPNDVSLVELGIGNQRYSVSSLSIYTTLNQLNINQGDVLYFEPSNDVVPPRSFRLTISGPNFDKAEYQWNKDKTTLKMLLEYIIKIFSLESIEHQRIHLFQHFDELDLSSNPDKLLIDSGITDQSLINVEIIPPISSSVSRTNTMTSERQLAFSDKQRNSFGSSNTESNEYIELQLHYKNHRQDLDMKRCAVFSLTDTIHIVIERFLKIADLDHICPDDISLVALSIDNQHSAAPPSNTNMTLQQLNIKQGHVLYFEPSATVTSPRLYQLTLWGPDSLDKAEYEWDKAKTTLNMLLEYVIKIFSLESIAKERIHLVTLLESELNIMSDSDKLLSELNITDQESIFVQIVPSRSSSTVHVECAHISGTQLLDISHTTTIDEVIHQIEQRFKDHSPLNVKLFDRMHNKIDLNISNQTLSNLGINPGETIYASVRLAHSNNQSSTVDARINRALRSSSLIAKNQPGDVLVNVKFSEFDRTTIEISVNDTVDDLIKKIKALKKNRTLSIVVMSSGSILIDDKKLDHRLGDIGIKPGDAIDVIAIDKTPTYYSSTSSYVTTSSTPSRLLETRRSFSMPIGLYNLGNTCYMNSALQCLAHAKPLTEFFLDGLTQDASDDDKYLDAEWNQFYTIGTVTGAYADLLRNLYLPNKTMNYCHAFRPTHIREIIGVQAPRFATSDQQDAQEFMTFLLDEIHRELKEKNGNESNTIIEELFFGKIQSTITCLECKHEEKTTNPISFLPLPLVQQGRRFLIKFISRYGNNELAYVYVSETGQVKNLIQAFAESDSSRTLFGTIMVMANDEQLDLEMPLNQLSTREVILIEKDDFASGTQFNRLNRHTKKLTLEDCLREFCSLEPLEDSWSCQQETCKKNTKATKQLQICSLPPILIIQFKRFSHEDGLREKLETFVDYPINGLNLTSFLSSSSEDIIYDLFAVSKHTGSIYGGHYTACARHESNGKSEWYEFNDTITSSFCFDSDIVSKDAYLLFYIKRENPRQSTQITTS
ncbi:unnamed protein product [Rotaria sp. Silwood1]|nr:unnamed protein product [Rotaria sp. Silwood1]CAF1126212.1 unnamed protein product [Rotaria sp. Silwood1]CAF3438592.1 unnamed protein product [Rotaria sp. Silwood1]CAF4691477.1 unnamed protein product [Rotaria sp. Silwood1]